MAKSKLECMYFKTCINAQKCGACPGYFWHTDVEMKAIKDGWNKRFPKPGYVNIDSNKVKK